MSWAAPLSDPDKSVTGYLLDRVARRLLPRAIHDRLVRSDLARRLARGSAWSLAGSAAFRILILVGMILVARILGREAFGAFGLVQATLGVVGIFAGIGFGGTATRFVAQYATSDPARAGRIIGLVFGSSVATIVIASILLIAFSGVIARQVLHEPGLQSALGWGAILMAASAIRGIQNGVWAALERFDVIAKLNLAEGAFSVVGMVGLAALLGVEGAVLGLALGGGLVAVISRVLVLRELRSRAIPVRYRGSFAERRILVSYTLPNLLANVVATPVLWLAMTFVAADSEGLAGLGLYNAAYQWHGPLVFIPIVLMSVSIPSMVQAWEAGRTAQFRAIALWLGGLVVAVTLPFALIGAALSPWIMSLYGPDFSGGGLILILLLAAAPLHAIAKIASTALLGMHRAWPLLMVNVAWGVTLVGLTLLLLPGLGVLALAIAFLSAYAVLAGLTSTLVAIGSRSRILSAPAAGSLAS